MESPQAHREVLEGVVEGVGWGGGPFSNHRGWSYEETTVFRSVLEELPHILFCEHQNNIFTVFYTLVDQAEPRAPLVSELCT